jgi:heme exporter protein A
VYNCEDLLFASLSHPNTFLFRYVAMRLELSHLCFDYEEKNLFSNLHWVMESGQLWHLQGDNGAGKSTLLRLLAGLLEPTEGVILWNQRAIDANLRKFQQQLCYVGHKLGVHADLTVAENLYFDAHSQRRQVKLCSLLEEYHLLPLADNLCAQLSEGQKQRVALLRLAMTDAPLWLLDEPYSALDSDSSALLNALVQRHYHSGGLIIMTSHQPLPFAEVAYGIYRL